MAAARRATSASSLPQQTVWAADSRSDSGARPAASHASRTQPKISAERWGVAKLALNSSAYLAASAGVRRRPLPPMMTGGRGCCAGLGSAGESLTW